MDKPKLDLDNLTDPEVVDLLKLVSTSVAAHPTIFATPVPPLASLTTQANTIGNRMGERANLLAQAQAKTIDIRQARDIAEGLLTAMASYVDGIAKGDAAIIADAGMHVSSGGSPVGPMPKVMGLAATQGDSQGEVDLHWNPIKRGLLNYTIELTDDPEGLTGWRFAKNESKSKTSVTGLISGKRYWFRVTANGSAGPGPASDATTKVAP